MAKNDKFTIIFNYNKNEYEINHNYSDAKLELIRKLINIYDKEAIDV